MAADGITLRIDDAAVLVELDRLRGQNLGPAMSAIGAYLVTSTQQRFEREAGPDGKPWQRLSPRTANRRVGRRRRGTANILRVSGLLSSSIMSEAATDSVRVGTNVRYAAIQQLGGTVDMPARRQTIYQRYDARKDELDPRFVRKSASTFARDVDVKAHAIRIPARPYLGVDEADRAQILRILADHFGPTGGAAAP